MISPKQLRKLYWESKHTTFEIAHFFNCTAGTIVNRMKEYGIPRRVSGPKRAGIKKDTLSYLYLTRGLSAEKVGRIYHCDQTVILRTLKKYGISIRHPKKRVLLSKQMLALLYSESNLSIYKIGTRYHCDPKTVYKYLKLYGIPTRPRKVVLISKTQLSLLYKEKRYPLSKIAQLYDCQPATILRKMEHYGISRRTISETSTKHKKKDFTGSREEKAYLIGFRLGDLGVRKEWNLIHIGCGTTKTVQLDLIRRLFNDYGPGWITKKDAEGRFHINFALNRSFKFLLPKHYKIPQWIKKGRKLFLQFLAGYTDAEGNIGIYSKRARFRIRSYDYGILQDIHREFHRQGIASIFSLEAKPGVDKRGVRHNGTFWGVSVNTREDLYKLLNALGPFLRHEKRRNDLNAALQNVTLRLR